MAFPMATELSFDERNFNQSLLQSPQLLSTNWGLVRPKGPLGPRIPLPEKQTVMFGLVEGDLAVGNTKLSNCKRLGSLSTDGILLMDAQACRVDGDAKVLVGDKDEAAIMKVGSLVLVLDQGNSPRSESTTEQSRLARTPNQWERPVKKLPNLYFKAFSLPYLKKRLGLQAQPALGRRLERWQGLPRSFAAPNARNRCSWCLA